MKFKLHNPNLMETQFVKLNAGKCKACWKCIGACPNEVIGKVDFLWHRHARIVNNKKCSGCLKCVNNCETGSFERMWR